jgi:predicted deacylase
VSQPSSAPAVDVALPDLARWERGNAGLTYVWRFEGTGRGPHVTVQALTHGNEVCGAIALDWLLRSGFRPASGTLTLIFANAAAYLTFDAGDPFAARCLDEDLNRVWDAAVLDGDRRSRELSRARELRPCYDDPDYLLDLHSMSDACPALALCGRLPKGRALAAALRMPEYIVVDSGHQAGRRLRDYAHFDSPTDARNALLIECGQHWEAAAPIVAQQVMLRFLHHFGMVDAAFADSHLDTQPLPAQQTILVTDVVTIATEAFEFADAFPGMAQLARAGTLIARDGDRDIRTPYDDCVLIMPTRRPRRGETAVRLGRRIGGG